MSAARAAVDGVRRPVAVLGCGAMGEALLAGLLSHGMPAEDVLVAVRRPGRGRELEDRHGVRVLPAAEAAARAAVLVVAVKPQDVPALLAEVAPHVRPDSLVVSIAAGVATATLEAALPAGAAVARVMPSTPASIIASAR